MSDFASRTVAQIAAKAASAPAAEAKPLVVRGGGVGPDGFAGAPTFFDQTCAEPQQGCVDHQAERGVGVQLGAGRRTQLGHGRCIAQGRSQVADLGPMPGQPLPGRLFLACREQMVVGEGAQAFEQLQARCGRLRAGLVRSDIDERLVDQGMHRVEHAPGAQVRLAANRFSRASASVAERPFELVSIRLTASSMERFQKGLSGCSIERHRLVAVPGMAGDFRL